jgi:hypothetical protein
MTRQLTHRQVISESWTTNDARCTAESIKSTVLPNGRLSPCRRQTTALGSEPPFAACCINVCLPVLRGHQSPQRHALKLAKPLASCVEHRQVSQSIHCELAIALVSHPQHQERGFGPHQPAQPGKVVALREMWPIRQQTGVA